MQGNRAGSLLDKKWMNAADDKTPGALPSIWSYGHRNPQGLAVHPLTGELWKTEGISAVWNCSMNRACWFSDSGRRMHRTSDAGAEAVI